MTDMSSNFDNATNALAPGFLEGKATYAEDGRITSIDNIAEPYGIPSLYLCT